MFNAIYLTQEEGRTRAQVRNLDESELPAGDVQVRIDYSTLNYKDGLAITGQAPVVRHFPMIPGIDCCGEVVAPRRSSAPTRASSSENAKGLTR